MKQLSKIHDISCHVGCLTPLVGIPLCFTFGWRKLFVFFFFLTITAWIILLTFAILKQNGKSSKNQ